MWIRILTSLSIEYFIKLIFWFFIIRCLWFFIWLSHRINRLRIVGILIQEIVEKEGRGVVVNLVQIVQKQDKIIYLFKWNSPNLVMFETIYIVPKGEHFKHIRRPLKIWLISSLNRLIFRVLWLNIWLSLWQRRLTRISISISIDSHEVLFVPFHKRKINLFGIFNVKIIGFKNQLANLLISFSIIFILSLKVYTV